MQKKRPPLTAKPFKYPAPGRFFVTYNTHYDLIAAFGVSGFRQKGRS